MAAQTDRLNAIIEDLLTLSRIEQEEEKSEIELLPSPVHNVLETAVEVCRMKAAEKNIRLEMRCDDDLQAAMNAPLLEQAVINLLDNAVKYSPPEQTVYLQAGPLGDEIVIQVRATGAAASLPNTSRGFSSGFIGSIRPAPQTRRHRPGTGDRQAHRPGPRRPGDRRKRRRPRQRVSIHLPARPTN